MQSFYGLLKKLFEMEYYWNMRFLKEVLKWKCKKPALYEAKYSSMNHFWKTAFKKFEVIWFAPADP